jgi:hypothetical protein
MRTPWRANLATILNTAMEATWLSVLLLAIGATLAEPGVVVVGLPLFLFLYTARLFVSWLLRSRLRLSRSRLLLVYVVGVTFLLVLKLQNYPTFPNLSTAWLGQLQTDVTTLAPPLGSVIMTLITVAWVWWRALQAPRESEVSHYYFRQFQVGLIVVITISLLAGRVGLGPTFVPWVLWFFFWGMLSIAFNRLDDIAREQRIAVARYWLPIAFSITLLVVGSGVLMSAVFAQGALDMVRSLFQSLSPLLQMAATVIAFPIGMLVEALIVVLRPILQPLLNLVIAVASALSSTASPWAGLMNDVQRRFIEIPAPVREAVRWATVTVLLGAVLIVLALALRRRQAAVLGNPDELHESVFSAGELVAGLRSAWQRLLWHFRRSARPPVVRVAVLPSEEERAAHSVRQIYARLLALAARLGQPRPAAATPYEFLRDLAAVLPGNEADLAVITDAYVCARYGPGGSSDAELMRTQQAWQRVQTTGKRLPARRGQPAAEQPPAESRSDEFAIPEYMIKEIQRHKRDS